MNTCVSDDTVIINVQGLRTVTWGEANYQTSTNVGKPFFITVTFKGGFSTFYYRTESEARAIFAKAREAMDKTRSKNATNQ